MGHKSKNAKEKTLHQQTFDRLSKMQCFGESKFYDKKIDRLYGTRITSEKVYSFNTRNTYWKHIKYFVHYVQETHPECKKFENARKYVNEWLQVRAEQVDKNGKHLSAWTIQTEAAALNKLYGIEKDDPDRFQPPQRKRENITRSRGEKVRDRHFSEKNNEELINFCKGVGPRRSTLEKMKGRDLLERKQVEELLKEARASSNKEAIKYCTDALKTFPDKNYFVIHRGDKGGKTRISPICGPNVEKIVERFKATEPNKLVWEYVSSNCDVHGYRSNYATIIYKEYARPIKELKFETKMKCSDGIYRSEIYVCKGEDRGKKLDRKAIQVVSIALGHNREDTSITSYIRNL